MLSPFPFPFLAYYFLLVYEMVVVRMRMRVKESRKYESQKEELNVLNALLVVRRLIPIYTVKISIYTSQNEFIGDGLPL